MGGVEQVDVKVQKMNVGMSPTLADVMLEEKWKDADELSCSPF